MSESTKAVFLSYASQDVAAALRICAALRAAGVEVWLDQEGGLVGGDTWDRKIRKMIKECTLFVPVVSANTESRAEGYFRLEWLLAVERSRLMSEERAFLIPVTIDATAEATAKVPDKFREVQWTKAPGGDTSPVFISRLQKLLGGPEAPLSAQPAAATPAPSAKSDALHPAVAPRAESAARSRPGEGAERMKRRIRPLLQPAIIAASVVVGAGLGSMGNRMRSAGSAATLTPAPVTRLTLQLPVHALLALGSSLPGGWALNVPILSPDGRVMLYVASQGATSQIYLRALDQFEAKPIPGTEGGFSPFFSPDSVRFGFFAENKLKKMSIEGGAPVALCEVKNAGGGTWSTEEVIYYRTDAEDLLRMPVRGGVPEKVKGPTRFTFQGMPSGKELLLSIPEARKSTLDHWGVALFSPQRATVTPLDETGAAPCITASGHLLILRGGAILAAPFDSDHRVLLGRAVPVLEDNSLPGGICAFSVSERGTLLYIGGGFGNKTTPTWIDRNGHRDPLPMPAQAYGNFRLSPDGRRLAIEVVGGTSDIWIYETMSGKGIRLTTDGNNTTPLWSPDGTRVVYAAGPSGNRKLMVKSLAGGDAKELYASTGEPEPTAWSPDGRLVIFHEKGKGIRVVSVVGAAQPETIVESKDKAWGASLSADGAWIAYTSEESGRYENYVQPFPAGPRVQVSFDGGEEPLWSPQGGELIFRNGDKWLSVAYATTPGFIPETPREIIKGPYINVAGISWNFAPDAKRLLVLQPLHEQKVVTEVKVVLNWFEELKRRVPVASSKN